LVHTKGRKEMEDMAMDMIRCDICGSLGKVLCANSYCQEARHWRCVANCARKGSRKAKFAWDAYYIAAKNAYVCANPVEAREAMWAQGWSGGAY
jgi:hypothetical protein